MRREGRVVDREREKDGQDHRNKADEMVLYIRKE